MNPPAPRRTVATPAALPPLALRAHAHLMLVGFIGMMIFGVGLHVLPRFTGHALFSERLADAQFWLAYLGLLAMVLGWLATSRIVSSAGGAALWLSFALFALNVTATVRPWARRGWAMAEYCGCELPEDLWYDLDYLWARPNDDGTFTLGLTDPAQTMAGRVVSALLRKPGTHRDAGRNVATLESGKWVGGVPAPFVFGGGIDGDAPWRAAALHVYGLGFAAFLVFGLGEHLLPRFTGAPIRGGAIAWLQQALAHAGVIFLAWTAFALFAWRLAPVLMARSD